MRKSTSDVRPKINISDGILDIILVGAMYLVAQLVAIFVLGIFGGSTSQSSEKIIGAYILSGTVLSLGIFLVMKAYRLHARDISLKSLRLYDVSAALLGFGVYLVLTIIAGLLLRLIPWVDVNQEQDLGLDSVTTSLLPLAFLALAVVPPLVEELTFRGFLYHRLKFHKFPRIAAALIVSSIFGILHGQVNVAVDTFILSMVMIWVMERQKNLWVAVIVHSLKNTLAFFVLFVFGAG